MIERVDEVTELSCHQIKDDSHAGYDAVGPPERVRKLLSLSIPHLISG